MSNFSPRLGLTLPVEGESMALAPAVLSGNYDIIDRSCHCQHVANLAAVTIPFDGQFVWSIADSAHFVRRSGVWVNTNTPPVLTTPIKATADTTTQVDFTTTELKIAQATFTAAVGKRYLVVSALDMTTTDTSSHRYVQRIRYAIGATVANTDTLLNALATDRSKSNSTFIMRSEFFPNLANQYTVGMFAIRTSGTGTLSASKDVCNSTMAIIDWTG